MSKDTFKQAADALFASTAHNTLWANPKGEFFTSENTGNLSLKPGQKLSKFERTVAAEATEENASKVAKVLNAQETINAILKTTSLEELKAFEADERKTVKAEYQTKHAELTAAINVVGETTEGGTPAKNGNEDTETQK
jgi:hypothetical protein